MKMSEHINELATALAEAQAEFKPVAKTKHAKAKGVSKSGKDYEISYAYADIADVLSAIMPILAKHKIAILQPTVVDGNVMTVLTRLVHASGQWMESEYPVCALNGDHQKMGGAMTYARRYALCSLVGVAADEDIDGQDAAEPAPKSRPDMVVVPERAAKEPAVTSKAIAMGREIKALTSLNDLEAFKRTDEFKAFWIAAHQADRQHIVAAVEQRKAQYASDLIGA